MHVRQNTTHIVGGTHSNIGSRLRQAMRPDEEETKKLHEEAKHIKISKATKSFQAPPTNSNSQQSGLAKTRMQRILSKPQRD
jgi:hypothetical protein